jgi:ADP-ribosyl-[dinitrogen reductase] hydrolase
VFVEIAIGDAYGAGFEFSAREKINLYNFGNRFIEHELGIPAGKYTDDTQMSIAIAEILLADIEFTKDSCADSFIQTFKRDKRQGYAKRFQSLIETCESGVDLIKNIKPESTRNGAAMRSVPLGLIKDKDKLLESAKIQASVTHETPAGIISSQIIALTAHKLIYEKINIHEIPVLIQEELGFEINMNWRDEVDCDAIQTVHAVFSALARNREINDLLIDCVNYGGDVDSVAAIALGLASLSSEYENAISENLLSSLENEVYGFDFLKQLDKRLKQKYHDLLIFY